MTQRALFIPASLLALALTVQVHAEEKKETTKKKEVDLAKVVATVNGEEIKERSVQRGLRRIPPSHRAKVRGEVINVLIEQMLLDQYLRHIKTVVPEKEVKARIAEMKKSLAKREMDYKEVLEKMLLTETEFREHVEGELRWEKFVEKYVTDKTAKDYFTKNKNVFDGSMVHARHLLIVPKKDDPQGKAKAATKLKQLKSQIERQAANAVAGLSPDTKETTKDEASLLAIEQAFAAVAKKESDCPSKARGGDVGWFHRTGTMVEPFAKTAFALRPYQISDVVETSFGFHLILVSEQRPGNKITYEEIKDEVKSYYEKWLREALTKQLRQRGRIVLK